jgi:hypothetical protein
VFGKKQSFSDAQVTNSSLRAQLLMPYWMSCAWRMLTCTNACMHFKLVWILSIRALTLVVGFVFCFFKAKPSLSVDFSYYEYETVELCTWI